MHSKLVMRFELVMLSLQTIAFSYWQNSFGTVFASWGKMDIAYHLFTNIES